MLVYLANRRRTVAIVELAAELEIATETVRTILGRLSGKGLVKRAEGHAGPWGRGYYSATPSGRRYARALAAAITAIAPLTAAGLTRRQAEVLRCLLPADGPLTLSRIAARYVMCGNQTIRAVLRDLAARGLCDIVETHDLYGTAMPGYLATDTARALAEQEGVP